MASYWDSERIELVSHHDPGRAPPPADLAFSHIDMTATDEDYARLFDAYPLTINGNVLDISKSTFSGQILRRGDSWDGPVIVKTDRNFGGMREMQARYLAGDPDAIVDLQRPWRRVEFLSEYPAFASIADVPLGVWRNPNLVVEKFLPEPFGQDQYILRVWVFFGDREIYYQCVSNEPIIKSHNTLRREGLDSADIPAALRETRRKLGFDYGKFDFGIVGGEVVLYDVNRTPGASRGPTDESRVQANILELSKGLDAFTSRL